MVYIVQKAFHTGKVHRTIYVNSHYMVFENHRTICSYTTRDSNLVRPLLLPSPVNLIEHFQLAFPSPTQSTTILTFPLLCGATSCIMHVPLRILHAASHLIPGSCAHPFQDPSWPRSQTITFVQPIFSAIFQFPRQSPASSPAAVRARIAHS